MYKKSWMYMNKLKVDRYATDIYIAPGAPGAKVSAPCVASKTMAYTSTTQCLELDVTVNAFEYEEGIKDILQQIKPKWNRDAIKFEHLQGGMVNLMLSAFVDESNKSDWVVVRLFSVKLSEELVQQFGLNRSFEMKSAKLFEEIGVGPQVLAMFKNGVVYGYIDGTRYTWGDLSDFREEKLRNAVARSLALVHSQKTTKLAVDKYGLDQAPYPFGMLDRVGKIDWGDTVLIDEETTKWYNSQVPSFEERKTEMDMILEKMKTTSLPETFCHADCNPTNIIYKKDEDKVFFVDFEASGLCNPVMDMAAFLDAAGSGYEGDPTLQCFTMEEKRDFLRVYLAERNRLDKGSEDVDEEELNKFCDITDMYIIGANFITLIMVVPLIQAGAGDHWLKVGLGRYENYKKNKERMLSLHC